MNRNELEAARLQRFAADAEKKRAEEKCLEAYDQLNNRAKEVAEARMQRNQLEVVMVHDFFNRGLHDISSTALYN